MAESESLAFIRDALRYPLCALLFVGLRESAVKYFLSLIELNVETGKVKSQDRFRFDGGQSINVDLLVFSIMMV